LQVNSMRNTSKGKLFTHPNKKQFRNKLTDTLFQRE
jgi:hypothetical protein